MTHDPSFDGAIATPEEFQAVLGRLLAAADRNGVEPRGSWEYRSNEDGPDWEVMVVELEKPAESDRPPRHRERRIEPAREEPGGGTQR